VVYNLRGCASLLLELNLIPVILYPRVSQRSQLGPWGTSVPLLDIETLSTPLVRSPAQSIRIAVFLTGSMFDPVGKFGQDFEPSGDVAGRFGSLAQLNQGGMIRTQPELPAV